MNKTTGLDATALSIAALVSVDNNRKFAGINRIDCGFEKALTAVMPDNRDGRRKA